MEFSKEINKSYDTPEIWSFPKNEIVSGSQRMDIYENVSLGISLK
jgi:hypothetical protein